MILNELKPTTENGGLLSEQFFDIADKGMIFGILRSKLYSNPILAICREISCNARDAHREVGDFKTPITIHLPNALEPEYRVKDNGPGISPERVENIFVKYAASTKRGDNIQGGAFGIGSKVPMSYADSFTVITTIAGIKYSYTCYLDETNVGKMALLNQEKTSEPNGTEIVIPVKNQDFHSFKLHTEEACRHWDIKPNITGGTITWTEIKTMMSGTNWSINSDNHSNNHYYGYDGTVKAIIDGIEYPLDLVALKKYADTKLITNCRGTLHLVFGIGELSLAANREQIYLDKPTQEKIKLRIESVSKEVVKLAEAKIDAMPNYWQANLYYKKQLKEVFSDLAFLGNLTWRGTPLLNVNGALHIGCLVYNFSRKKYRSKLTNLITERITREIGHDIKFVENSELFINDLDIDLPTNKFVTKAFDDPNVESVQLICPTSHVTEEDLNKLYYIDLMKPKKISTITSYKKPHPRTYSTANKMLVFKLKQTKEGLAFCQSSFDDMKKDKSEKVLCSLARSTHYSNVVRKALLNGAETPLRTLQNLMALNPGVSFYGIDKDVDQARINKQFAGISKLDDFVAKTLCTKDDYLEVRVAKNFPYNSNFIGKFDVKTDSDDWTKLIKNPKSLLLARVQLAKRFQKLLETKTGMLEIFESINDRISEADLIKFLKAHPELNVDTMNRRCREQYPLLQFITNEYNECYKPLTDYINNIDDTINGDTK